MMIEQVETSSTIALDRLNFFYAQIIQACQEYFLHPHHLGKMIAYTLKDRDVLNKIEKKEVLTTYDERHLEEYLLRVFKEVLPQWSNIARSRAEAEKFKEEQLKRIAEQKRKELEEQERQKALEADPIYREKQRQKALLASYDINEQDLKSNIRHKLLVIINQLKKKKRLSQEDSIWLNSEGYHFFNSKIRHAFHRLEANFYLEQYQKDKNQVWHAINASSQLRKCKASLEAEDLLISIQLKGKKDSKLLSAYFTTLGGVRRDLHKTKIAIENASKAHHLTPKNYRPCTLLGAIYMETYQYTLGHEWYEKASVLGAPDQSIQADLKSIIMKLDKTKRSEMIDHLLKLDAKTYQWLKTLKIHSITARPSKKKEGNGSSAKNEQDKPAQNPPKPKHKTDTPKAKSAVNQSKT